MLKTRCPRHMHPRHFWMKSDEGNAWVPPQCRTWKCTYCGPKRALNIAYAIDRSNQTRFLTFTSAPSDIRQGMARLRHLIADSYPIEWIWTAEKGESTGMVHTHAISRGSYIPQRYLSQQARAAGFGCVTDIRSATGFHGAYASKCARYAAKNVMQYELWLGTNGGKKPWHWSRKFCDGLPIQAWVDLQTGHTTQNGWTQVSQYEVPPEIREQYPLNWGLGYTPSD